MILDSDVLIDLLRGNSNALTWFASLPTKPFVSSISVLEVTFGARDALELRRVQAFLHGQPVIWVEPADCKLAATYATIRLTNGMGILDGLTAALCVRMNQPLATFNVKHFAAVPALTTIRPYTR